MRWGTAGGFWDLGPLKLSRKDGREGRGEGAVSSWAQVRAKQEGRKAVRDAKRNLRLVILQTARCHLAHQARGTAESEEGEKARRFVEHKAAAGGGCSHWVSV